MSGSSRLQLPVPRAHRPLELPSLAQSRALIRLDGLERHYRMGSNVVRALDGVGLEIHRGEFVAIVGASGSGKSTLMNIIGCLDQPTGGDYHLSGEHVSTYTDTQLSHLRNRRIGFVFQQFHLLQQLTVRENVELPLAYRGMPVEDRHRRSAALAKQFGMDDRLDHRPTELSGGQAQRVAVMRCLLTEPDILLLDEPTGALDSRTGRQIMDLFHDLHAQGQTIIMVTHDRHLAEEAARVVEIRDGKIVADRAGEQGGGRSRSGSTVREPVWHGGIGLRDLLRIGVREGLLVHKMRSALTMLGIIIGVSAVIAMSSFSLGSKKKQADQIRALGANQVRILDAGLENEALGEARVQGSRGLSQDDVALVKRVVPGIVRLGAKRDLKVRVHHGPQEIAAEVHGITGDYLGVNNLEIAHGRGLSIPDQVGAVRVCVLGGRVAAELADPPEQAIGQRLQLGRDHYRVIGILGDKQIDTRGLEATGAGDHNRSVLIPLSCVLLRTADAGLRSELDEIQLELDREERLFEAGVSIRRQLTASHQGVVDFELVIPLDLLKQKQQSQRLLDVLTLCISSISLLVGGIGIMNIMLASVTERLKEIGIRRAIGATRRDIKLQFLGEAMVVSVTGGLVGMVLSVLLVLVVGNLLDIPPVFSLGMVLLAVGASTLTGLVFGYYPAQQAAKRNVVEVLRNE
jgi:macrolide transport system ATP-binding/permease protein